MGLLKAKYNWELKVPGIIPDKKIFEHILKNRDIDDADHFFNMGKEMLADPFLFIDMHKAVNRIHKAISACEKIMIFGDYDCDGISAIAVLYRALKKAGATVEYSLPDRFNDGYGLSLRAVDDIINQRVKLLITVDNGITSNEEVAKLNATGIDTIITDHHETIGDPPPALAILHTKFSPNYPFKELAGVGISYKLATAVLEDDLDELLDLVMIGTVADLVLLQDENQALVNLGLAQLKKTTNLGLKKLLLYSHLDQINVTAIAFKIAPKINSSGRLGKAKDAVDLLISESDEEVNRLILDIEANHVIRKELTDEAYRECEKMVDIDNNVLVLSSPTLHEGVIGICAQKIAEKYQKSTCVIYIGDDQIGKGSMRSFASEDILSLLNQSSDLLIRYGGHSQAAGLAIATSNIPALQKRFNALSVVKKQPLLKVDMQVSAKDISIATIKQLEKFSFFTARFLFSEMVIIKKMIMTDKHTKLIIADGELTMEAIAFNNCEYYYRLEEGDTINIVGGISLNTWRNSETMQIMIEDLACDHFQVLDLRNQDRYLQAQPCLKRMENAMIIDDDLIDAGFDVSPILKHKQPSTIVIGYSAKAQIINQFYNKEVIGSIYHQIEKRSRVSIAELELITHLPLLVIEPIVNIFIELKLINLIDGIIEAILPVSKQNLADSISYNRMMETRRLVDFLTNESLPTLKQYFLNLMEA